MRERGRIHGQEWRDRDGGDRCDDRQEHGRQDHRPRQEAEARTAEPTRLNALKLSSGCGVWIRPNLAGPFAIQKRQVRLRDRGTGTERTEEVECLQIGVLARVDGRDEGPASLPVSPSVLQLEDERPAVIELLRSVIVVQQQAAGTIADANQNIRTLEAAASTLKGLGQSTQSVETGLTKARQQIKEAEAASQQALEEAKGEIAGAFGEAAAVYYADATSRDPYRLILVAQTQYSRDRVNRWLLCGAIDLTAGEAEGDGLKLDLRVGPVGRLNAIDSGPSKGFLRAVADPKSRHVVLFGICGKEGDLTVAQKLVATNGRFAESFDIDVEGSDQIRYRVTPKAPSGMTARPEFGTIAVNEDSVGAKIVAAVQQANGHQPAQVVAGGEAASGKANGADEKSTESQASVG